MTVLELALAAGIPEEAAEDVIWGATGYPCFFDPRRGHSPARVFWYQLHRASRILRRGDLNDYLNWAWSPSRCIRPWKPPGL